MLKIITDLLQKENKLLLPAQKGKRGRLGFTLIEMLVVIALISALATIAVPTIYGMVNTSRINTDHANLQILKSAVEAYYANQDPFAYPESLSDLVRVNQPYLRDVPTRLTGGWDGEDAKSDEAWGYQGLPSGNFIKPLPDNGN